uniref:Anaphase-promoting complex subunit 4 WD40 domain-containing protein n=1 Tax=Oryza brachyantha TaxID=4533 RepID=J3LCZ7_ORYBR
MLWWSESHAAVACVRAHNGGFPVSCLELNGDDSILVSDDYDGEVAVFVLLPVLDADADDTSGSTDLSLYRIPAHAAPVTQ